MINPCPEENSPGAGPAPELVQGGQAEMTKIVFVFGNDAMRYALCLPAGQVLWQAGAMRFSP